MSFAEAIRFIKEVESVFRTMDLQSIVGLFTESASIKLPFAPAVVGRKSIAEFFRARYADITHYSLDKEVVAVHENRIAVKLQAQWRSAATGALHRSSAMEVLTVEVGRIAVWEMVSVSQAAEEVRA